MDLYWQETFVDHVWCETSVLLYIYSASRFYLSELYRWKCPERGTCSHIGQVTVNEIVFFCDTTNKGNSHEYMGVLCVQSYVGHELLCIVCSHCAHGPISIYLYEVI